MDAYDIIKNIVLFQDKAIAIGYCNKNISKDNIKNKKEKINVRAKLENRDDYILIEDVGYYDNIYFCYTGRNTDYENKIYFNNNRYDYNLKIYVDIDSQLRKFRMFLKDYDSENIKKAINSKKYYGDKFKEKLLLQKKDLFISFENN